MNLSHYFEKIYSRDTIQLMKPYISSAISVQKDIIYNNNLSLKNKSIKNKYLFFDDLVENLKTGKSIGWTTIWIHKNHHNKILYNFIDYSFPNIIEALKYFNN